MSEQGWLHGPNGAGHFVKMHNGIEYGVMAAYAEGMAVSRPRISQGRASTRRSRLARSRTLSVRPQPPDIAESGAEAA